MEMSDMPEDVRQRLKNLHFVEIHPPGCGCPAEEKGGWVQVGSLKPEDITRTATMRTKLGELQAESKILMAKLESVKAQHTVVNAEYWEHLVKTYSLPRTGIYEVRKSDNAIMMRQTPKKP